MTPWSVALPGTTESVASPRVVRAYAEWLGQQSAASFDAYYTEPRARFEPRGGDVLQAPGDVQVTAAACGSRVTSERASASVEVCGLRASDGARVFDAIDGARTADDVRRKAGLDDAAWTALVASLFGTVVFAPLAVGALEARAPSAEIVRFPGSPYEIVRPYWENMGLLRERLGPANGDLAVALGDTASFVRLLRELHALVLVGDGASFYRPASPVAAKQRFAPGELATAPVVTEASPEGVRFVSGLRVSAAPLGGPHYVPLLLEGAAREAAHDDAASALFDSARGPGPGWGTVVMARADTDALPAPWFCPPRPLEASHFDALATHLATAIAASHRGDERLALARVAAFHQGFVRLHPFGFANQCLAMALVNHVLRSVLGAGLSHLVLDHLALELPPDAYAVVFRRAALAWLSRDANPVHRTLELAHKKARCFGLMRALAGAESAEEARRLLHERGEDARLAFF